ncbi:MAG TPA: hypothetical protein VHB70_00670 [Parafilimonas sp.]|nr:hypothetical protein [Parafilimonas sp.]
MCACIIATVIALASPYAKAVNSSSPVNGGCDCYDKKMQIDQAKKNGIVKRFISYCNANTFELR